MKKFLKFIFIFDLVLLVLIITLPRYINQKNDVSRKIGEVWTGGTLTTNEYYSLNKLMELYLEKVKEGQFEEAYQYLSGYYRRYKDLGTFTRENEVFREKEYQLRDIQPLTRNLYDVSVDFGELYHHFLIMHLDNSFFIVPEEMIEYVEFGQTFKKNPLVFELISAQNYVDHYELRLRIKNQSKKDLVTIDSASLKVEGLMPKKGDLSYIEVLPEEEKELVITFSTHLSFPSQCELSYTKKGKSYLYQIDLSKK